MLNFRLIGGDKRLEKLYRKFYEKNLCSYEYKLDLVEWSSRIRKIVKEECCKTWDTFFLIDFTISSSMGPVLHIHRHRHFVLHLPFKHIYNIIPHLTHILNRYLNYFVLSLCLSYNCKQQTCHHRLTITFFSNQEPFNLLIIFVLI